MSQDGACEVCGSMERTHLYEVDGWSIMRCVGCGLGFVATPPSDADLVALYDASYYEDDTQPGYAGYAEAEARKRHHDRTLLDAIEALRPAGDLLEIGCAYGYFLDEARTRGWRVRGVEPSEHAVKYAKSQLHLDVSRAAFTDLAPEPEALDAVVLWDVIEHLPNPRQTVERAYRWLRPGGVIALSTGDFASLTARLHGSDWSLMTPPWHQFYFSRASVSRLLESAGFELVRMGGDGNVAVDRGSRRPRVPGPFASVLRSSLVTSVARRLGAGGILFAYARKPSS
ncbi:MAG: class I SAM-dependent methyltransferase [Sciscionella sp.]